MMFNFIHITNRCPTGVALALAQVCALVVALGGCDSSSEAVRVPVSSNQPSEFTLPQALRVTQAVDLLSLTLAVDVNNQSIQVPKTGENPDVWSAVVDVPANGTSIVSVNWSQQYRTRSSTVELTLAQQQKVVVVEADAQEVLFQPGGYNTANHDYDDDGMSNLQEIAEGRSPVHRIDGYIDGTGIYPTGQMRPASTQCGTQMPISTPIQIGDDVESTPGDISAWWCVKYVPARVSELLDVVIPEGIEIFVQVTDDVAPLSDSDRPFNDDSVEIFIDGNNSKGSNYDGWDDYQFIFRADGNNDSPMEKGRVTPANMTSETILSSSGYQLTVFIPIDEVSIQNGQPFGINLEVNDDDDGGNRDTKISWIGEPGFDRSWLQPAAFGTSQIP